MKEQIKTVEDLRSFAERVLTLETSGSAIGLSGELGAGKTEFVRQIIWNLSRRAELEMPKVASPTFVIHQSYAQLTPVIEHFDLYRMENLTQEGLIDIGYYDALENVRKKGGLLFVEWPEKAKNSSDLHLTATYRFMLLDSGDREILRSVL